MNCCPFCGRQLPPNETHCVQCQEQKASVQVLTPAEREGFEGITIEQESSGEQRDYQYTEYTNRISSHRIYVRQVNFGTGEMGLMTKLIIIAFVVMLIFVAVPLALFIAAVALLTWFIRRRWK